MRDVTVILPCAGKGLRLGLPFPKELAPLGPGEAVIDSCLSLIGKSAVRARIILLDDGNRELTREYIEGKLPDIPLAVIRQHRYAGDFPEGILRLEPFLGEVNIVMLPDAVYESAGDPVAQLADLAEPGFAMAACKGDPGRISRSGALAVTQDNIVRAYQDKPENPSPYNAVWGMLGFSGSIGMIGMRIISASTSRISSAKEPILGCPVIWLDDFRDCGTWRGYLAEVHRG